jgi:hypothetical protein
MKLPFRTIGMNCFRAAAYIVLRKRGGVALDKFVAATKDGFHTSVDINKALHACRRQLEAINQPPAADWFIAVSPDGMHAIAIDTVAGLTWDPANHVPTDRTGTIIAPVRSTAVESGSKLYLIVEPRDRAFALGAAAGASSPCL